MKDLNMFGLVATTASRAEEAVNEAAGYELDQPMLNFGVGNIRNVRTQKNSLETTSRQVETANCNS